MIVEKSAGEKEAETILIILILIILLIRDDTRNNNFSLEQIELNKVGEVVISSHKACFGEVVF